MMSDKRKEQLTNTKKELDKLSHLISQTINGELTQSQAAKELGITPQDWNQNANTGFIRQLHKIKPLTHQGILCLLKSCATPYEKLAYNIFGLSIDDGILILSDETEQILQNLITEQLTEREQKILSLYYGLDDGQIHTLNEIGTIFCITNNRVYQILVRSIRKLRRKDVCSKLMPAYQTYMKELHEMGQLTNLNQSFNDKISQKASLNNIPLTSLYLSVRTYNCLRRVGINTIGDVLCHDEDYFIHIRNFSQNCLTELKNQLSIYNLTLASKKD